MIRNSDFQSLGLTPSLYYVKINPLLERRTNDVFRLFSEGSYLQHLFFSCDMPQYMPTQQRENFTYFFAVELHQSFLWSVVTITPVSVLTAVAKIGGYFSFFGFIRFLLGKYHISQYQ